MLERVDELVEGFERLQFDHAISLQRITVLEELVNDVNVDIPVLTKGEDRVSKLLEYLESNSSISTKTAMRLLKVTHNESVHRAMRACVAKDSGLQLIKSSAGRLILNKK